MAGEADTIYSELIDVRGAEVFLTVAGNVVVSEVVGDDVDDVGFREQRSDEK